MGILEVVCVASVMDETDFVDGNFGPTHRRAGRIEFPALEAKEAVTDVYIHSDLSSERQQQVKRLLGSYQDVLTDLPGKTSLGSHSIRLKSDEPVRLKPYPLPHARRDVIREETKKMLDLGVIEHSESPYASPIVLVKKSDGTNRFCIDFRKLNRITIFDAEPMPNPDEIFACLSTARFFSKLDLSKGYWQIPLTEQDKEKTAFLTPDGLFQFKVMPFGLINAPATFSRVMRLVLHGLPHVHNYIDDILIHTETWEEHMATLKALLCRLRQANLTAKPSKCQLCCPKVEFLGHVVGEGLLKPMEDKLEKISNALRPETKKQLRSFLGLAGYYRKFIPNFSTIATPLTDRTKSREPNRVVWTERQEEAFGTLKKCLTSGPILCLPNFQKQFTLRTDASDTGIGAILLQDHVGDKQPVAYASRKLLPREQAYSVMERECLAIVWGITKFEVYLDGKEFVLETDHQPLMYLQRSKLLNSRIMRWALSLQPFRFRIEAIAGVHNVGADFLSRVSS